ncbi:MAG TPA: hypothetical protein VNL18_07355 [Gemmatimonadales bacterium]|nr:hypothetical protein [Gemmatimonadales bacterium]
MNPCRIKGPWTDGYTLDDHTMSSVLIGHDEFGNPVFDTKRSRLGESLFQLKYRGDRTQVRTLAEAAAAFIRQHDVRPEVIVPVPATRVRAFQPVTAVAEALGRELGVPVDTEALKRTAKARELKGVLDPSERAKLLDSAFRVSAAQMQGRVVLLFDDLYRSGATMNAAARLLLGAGQARAVFALALTRTRTKR